MEKNPNEELTPVIDGNKWTWMTIPQYYARMARMAIEKYEDEPNGDANE